MRTNIIEMVFVISMGALFAFGSLYCWGLFGISKPWIEQVIFVLAVACLTFAIIWGNFSKEVSNDGR